MSLTVSLPPELLEQLHYIEAHTQQDLNTLICKVIVREYEQIRSDQPNALELFEAAGLVGCIDGDPNLSSHYQPMVEQYLTEKSAQNQLWVVPLCKRVKNNRIFSEAVR